MKELIAVFVLWLYDSDFGEIIRYLILAIMVGLLLKACAWVWGL